MIVSVDIVHTLLPGGLTPANCAQKRARCHIQGGGSPLWFLLNCSTLHYTESQRKKACKVPHLRCTQLLLTQLLKKKKKRARCSLRGSLHATASNAQTCTIKCQNACNGNGRASLCAGNTFVVNIWASGWHKILTPGSHRHQTPVSIQYIAFSTKYHSLIN